MSQVNKFKQDQNPDFLYFDLQQTNVYNTTENIQQPLKFVETRDTPIVANSGDYHLSVTRFQLDTYNLPVLVVEPDLTQPNANYDPNQTIYKVALIPIKSDIKSQVQSLSTQILIENNLTNPTTYGSHVAFQPNTPNYSVVLGDSTNNRLIYRLSTDNINITQQFYSAPNIAGITGIGGTSVGISDDSQFLISNGSTSTADYTLVWSRANAPTSPSILPFDYASDEGGGPSQISGDGTKIIIGRLVGNSPDILSYKFNRATGAFSYWAQVISSSFNEAEEAIGTRGIAMSNNGIDVVVSNIYYAGPGAYERGSVTFLKMDYANSANPYETINVYEGSNGQEHFGWCVCMSANGLVVAVSAPNENSPYIKIYNKTTPGGATTWLLGQTLSGGQVELGDRMSLSADGTYLYVATNSTHRVKRFKKTSGTYAYEVTMAHFTGNNVNVASNSTGIDALIVNYGGATGTEEFIGTTQINVGDNFDLPPSTENIPVIKPVIWLPDYLDAEVPNKNVLTGKNTAFYQYYYCNAYENFIARVNIAIRSAYIALIEELYNDWVVPTNNASLTNVFIDIVLRQYAPPPFLEWNEAELKAELYATLFFQSYGNNEIPLNYASNPDVVWTTQGNNRIGTPGLIAPLEFQMAMNAPLYSLFNSFPASKKVLTAPVTLYKENYYILNFFTTGNDLVNPSIPLHTMPVYSFIPTYTVNSVIQYPSQYTANIGGANLLIRQPQELSTIDTWTPINAIVFTTTSLPIVVNQFSASSSIGDKPPSGSTSNEFAFIITDIQSNDQGFRPNVLYTPSAQFRYIDLTGNQPIRNIDIAIFWRSTTGALIPMVLASGAQASIKLLFEKKDKTNQKEANASTLATSVRDIV